MLIRATWPSGTITFRSLAWGEYREIRSLLAPPAEKALQVYNKCIVSGPTVDRVAAGIMIWVYQKAYLDSPFSGSFPSISQALEHGRVAVGSAYLLTAQAMIASVFKVPFETMDQWDSDRFFTRLAQAEFISGVPLNPIDPAVPLDKKGRPKKQKKAFTDAQKIAIERKYGSSAVPASAAEVRDAGRKPSQERTTDVKQYEWHKSNS